jgi:hypothetical protein
MIQWNTKIINSIGIVSFTQSQNADVLMNIIKKMDEDGVGEEDFGSKGGVFVSLQSGLDVDDLGRPIPDKPKMPEGMEESYVQQPFSEFKSDKDGNEVVPATFDQVVEDLQRIDMSVRAFASNNLFQKQSLDLIYERVSSGE